MMSNPNARRLFRRWSDERIWREFMAACLTRQHPSVAALQADEAYKEYRERFPLAASTGLDTEPSALDSESTDARSGSQKKRGVQ